MIAIIYYLVIFLAVVAFFVYRALDKLIKTSTGLTLELDPPAAEKGTILKIIVRASPTKPITILRVDGDMMAKKYDGYKGSWLDKTDYPFISNGILLSKLRFSFGKNIKISPGEENVLVGKVPVPDDAEHTEYRGSLQTRWFVTLRVKFFFMPTILLKEELVVHRPVIYATERLTFEADDKEVEDLYDPTLDLSERNQKKVDEEEDEEEEEEEESYEIPIPEEDEEKKPSKPIKQKPTPVFGYQEDESPKEEDRSSLLKIEYRTPFAVTQPQENVITSVSDFYNTPGHTRDSSVESGRGIKLFQPPGEPANEVTEPVADSASQDSEQVSIFREPEKPQVPISPFGRSVEDFEPGSLEVMGSQVEETAKSPIMQIRSPFASIKRPKSMEEPPPVADESIPTEPTISREPTFEELSVLNEASLPETETAPVLPLVAR